MEQECIPVGCVPAARRPYAGVCFRGGSPSGGVLHRGGSPSRGVLHPRGGSPSWEGGLHPGGMVVVLHLGGGGHMASQHALRQTPSPPVDRHTPVTRMHSSRMCTGRSLTVCCSVLPGGGFSLVWEGVPGLGGFSLVQGGYPWSGGVLRRTPPVNRITDTCKNITLATTSLRPVKTLPWPQLRCGR